MSRYSLCFAFFVLSSVTALCQPSFEVSSIKLHDRNDPTYNPPLCTNERFVSRALPVHQLVYWAYDLRPDQANAIEKSLPESARFVPYDIQAVASKPVKGDAECKQMVQKLLAERFALKSHLKTVPNVRAYELRIVPGVQKLKPVTSADTGCGVHISLAGQERPCNYDSSMTVRRGLSLKELAQALSIYTTPDPIFDMTGLTGEFKMSLSFTRRTDDTSYPLMQAALKDQLGLELRDTKRDAETLVIDSVQEPSAN
ncbi:MAG: TIGR03435 family protein [Acidobacteriota bacterium]